MLEDNTPVLKLVPRKFMDSVLFIDTQLGTGDAAAPSSISLLWLIIQVVLPDGNEFCNKKPLLDVHKQCIIM